MTIHLLLTPDVPPIPPGIEIIGDFGEMSILSKQGTNTFLFTGKHVMVEGAKTTIERWLGILNGFWLGVGHPQRQQFEIAHIS